jgi:hypothetical protein
MLTFIGQQLGATTAVATRFIFHSQGPKALPTKHNLASNDLNKYDGACG